MQRSHLRSVVGVAVHYDVGYRSESPGSSGFAHLFEHMMFQGSENVAPTEHFQLVQAAGGNSSGSTHQDFTDYYQVVPSPALERVLFLEADRMRSLRIDEHRLSTQIAVVKEEIRSVVTNVPHGGFPWTVLPSHLYRRFSNAHNGYGDFTDLDAATVADCRTFFTTYYSPNNAVLTVCGDIDFAEADRIVEQYFGDIPARATPARHPLDELPPPGERRGIHHDPHSALAATALGYRMADPATDPGDYLATMMLCQVLTGSEFARLTRGLVRDRTVAIDVSSSCGLFGPLRARCPETLLLVAVHSPDISSDMVVQRIDAELDPLARSGPHPGELARALAIMSSSVRRAADDIMERTRMLGRYELLYGKAELADDLCALLADVDNAAIGRAIESVISGHRAIVSLVPGKGER